MHTKSLFFKSVAPRVCLINVQFLAFDLAGTNTGRGVTLQTFLKHSRVSVPLHKTKLINLNVN